MARTLLRKLLCALLAVSTALQPVLLAAQPLPGVERAESMVVNIDTTIALLQKLQSSLDRSQFDLDAALDGLDFDEQNIIRFVTQQVYFEQYPGLLRGARATFLSRAGNALDQSVLLSHLLKNAGLESRVVRGQLSSADAAVLLGELSVERVPRPPMGDEKAIAILLEKLGWYDPQQAPPGALSALLGDSVSAERVVGVGESREIAQDMLARLEREKSLPPGQSSPQKLVEEARDYFWVEYRWAAGDAWQAAHPALSRGSFRQPPKPAEYFSDAIPEALQHRVGVEIAIEVARRGKLSEQVLIPARMVPAANLLLNPVTFSNIPQSLMTGPPSRGVDIERIVADSAWFVPYIEGTGQSGPVFDLRGNTLDPMAAGSASALFAQVQDAFTEAIKGLGGGASVPVLTSQVLRITLRDPAGETTTHTRRTFDLVGEHARRTSQLPADLLERDREAAAGLLKTQSLMISAGGLPPGLVLDDAIENMLEVLGSARADLLAAIAGEQRSFRPGDLSTHWPGHAAMQEIFGMANALSTSHSIYRPAPAVFLWGNGVSANGIDAEAFTDIIANPVRAVDHTGTMPRLDPAMALRVGVWETVVEGIGLQAGKDGESVPAAYLESLRSGGEITWVDSADDLNGLKLNPDERQLAERDLQSGHSLLVPRAMSGAQSITGWWRVHRETGQTLGMTRYGRGSETVMYITLAVTVIGFLVGVLGCASESARLEREGAENPTVIANFWCCVGITVLFTAAGFWIAAKLSAMKHILVTSGGTSVMWDFVGLQAPTKMLCPDGS